MVNLQHYFRFNSVFLFSTLFVYSSTALADPIIRCEAGILDLAVIGVKAKKLVDKFERYRDAKDADKLISVMLDMKHEAELATGKKISIANHIKEIEKEQKKKGRKFQPGHLEAIKKLIEKKEKRHEHKVIFMAECIQLGIVYDDFLEEICFLAKHKDEKGEVAIPLDLTLAVTACLAGGFLMLIPTPATELIGYTVAAWGTEHLIEFCIEEAKKEKK